MEVKNCRGCNRLFNYMGGGYLLCPACKEQLGNKFSDVKKYIRENPKATMNQISEDNDVTVKQIERWVREDRLVFADDSPIGIDCEGCGAMIKSGRFCNSCAVTMQRSFGSMYNKPSEPQQKATNLRDKAKMRYLD